MYLNTSFEVVVLSTLDKHHHEEDPEFTTKENYHCTVQQEKVPPPSHFLPLFLTLIFDPYFLSSFFTLIFDNLKDSTGDLTFETLITILTIENLNSDNHCYLIINCDWPAFAILATFLLIIGSGWPSAGRA